ncbi:MAG: hypothetical protein HRU80_00100 [Ignavibacteriales bacterium]|nr:MAG: hypothetical protein HRU80_00100 [Ignavibacteriales bacterium]
MKRLLYVLVLLPFLFAACDKDDNGTNPPVTPPAEPMVGTWNSENIDVAPGLIATLKTKKIVATFNSNNTYQVVATDSTNTSVTYSGTYTTSAATGTTIRNIVLNQTVPTSVTSTGIYEVNAKGHMKYEVVQTTPAIPGFTAPVASEGFGSTKYNNIALGQTWIQGYVKPVPASEPIVGSWLSEGDFVAPGLKATLKTKSITATFNANNTYTVVATDSANVAVTYTGTFTTTAASGTTIRNIVLNQTTPTSVTSTGIYQVTAKGVLTYEVVQTTPAIPGFGAPTVSGGFGSTSYNSFPLGATWIQKFVATN